MPQPSDVTRIITGGKQGPAGVAGPVGSAAWGGITGVLAAQTDLQTALDAKATPAQITAAIDALIAGAPGALDTLNELAAALGDDANFAATVTAALAAKAADSAVVHDTGDESIDGVKTFTSDPIIPDEVYGVGWNGSLEPPTKNAVYDKIETLGAGGGLAVGSAVTGGGANRVLYEDAAQNLAAGAGLTFDGNSLTITSTSAGVVPLTIDAPVGQTDYLFRIGKGGAPAYFRIDKDGNIADIGGLGKRIHGNSSGIYFPDGILVEQIASTSNSTATLRSNVGGAYPFAFIAPTTGGGRALTLAADAAQSVNVFEIVDAGFIPKFWIDNAYGVGITGNIGFHGTAPLAKPTVTGSRGGNAALASLLTELANYGLITDGTT